MSIRLLDGKIVKSETDQSVWFRYTVEWGAYKVRFHIRSGAYRSTSSAIAQVWRDAHLDWSTVASLLPDEMETEVGIIYQPAHRRLDAERWFEDDYDTLQRRVALILGDA